MGRIPAKAGIRDQPFPVCNLPLWVPVRGDERGTVASAYPSALPLELLLLDRSNRSGSLADRLRTSLIAGANRTTLAVVHMAVDGHAFARRGRYRLHAGESEASKAEGYEKRFTHFPISWCVDWSLSNPLRKPKRLPALLLPLALLILYGFRRRAHSRLADLACGETSLLAPIVGAPLVADDSAICGGSLIDGGERGEAREAESNDENFAHFPFP